MNNAMPLFDFSDFQRIKEDFWKSLRDGKTVNCPCCHRFSHFNRFKINRSMVLAACSLYAKRHSTDDGFVHHKKFMLGFSRGFYDLGRFGFLEQRQKNDADQAKRTSGYWKLTQGGIDFLMGKTRVPKYAYVFDDEVRGYSEELISVHDAMGENFNFYETIGEWESM